MSNMQTEIELAQSQILGQEKPILDEVLTQTKQQQPAIPELIRLREQLDIAQRQINILVQQKEFLERENQSILDELRGFKSRRLCPICGDPNCPESHRLSSGYY